MGLEDNEALYVLGSQAVAYSLGQNDGIAQDSWLHLVISYFALGTLSWEENIGRQVPVYNIEILLADADILTAPLKEKNMLLVCSNN